MSREGYLDNEWTETLEEWANSPVSLVGLLELVTEATRELCAEFPQHNCHNGATNNWEVGKKVAKHLKVNYR